MSLALVAMELDLFEIQRQHELDAFKYLVKKEEGEYDISNNRIIVRVVELGEETDEDRLAFLEHLWRTRNILFAPFADLYEKKAHFTTRLDFKVWYSYTNVFTIDSGFLFQSPPGYICEAFTSVPKGEDGLYESFVWLFYREDSDFLGMIGIRGSLVETLQGGRRGLAKHLLSGVVSFAAQHNKRTILVPQPLWGMRELLHKKGFCEVERTPGDEENAEIEFMRPICNPNYYAKCELFQEI